MKHELGNIGVPKDVIDNLLHKFDDSNRPHTVEQGVMTQQKVPEIPQIVKTGVGIVENPTPVDPIPEPKRQARSRASKGG